MSEDALRTILGHLGDLREDIADHRGDVREQLAEARGVLDTLGQVKTVEHEHIRGEIARIEHRQKNTDAALDAYQREVRQVKQRLDRLAWVGAGIGAGSSLGGGTLAYILGQLFAT